MEKAMYPLKTIRITQKDHVGTHAACWAVDEAGKDSGISSFTAPFTGYIRKIYPQDANEVWLESESPVEYPDGTIDYMTILFAHCNDVSHLKVGQKINQGKIFYSEGTKGNATGNHVHMECGKGKFTGSGWYKDATGAWSIINGKKIDECLWIDDSYIIKNDAGYNFKIVATYHGTPVERNEKMNQIKINENATIVRARKTPNGKILGYMNSGIYNSLEIINADGYDWHKVENELWFAHSNNWSEYLPQNENRKIGDLQNEIIRLNKKIENIKSNYPKLIFESTKLDYYAIKLDENQKLYLG